MKETNMNRIQLNNTISYLLSGIILSTVPGLLLSNLVLSISGIVLLVVGIIISLIISLILSLIISLIQIFNNLIESKTMTGKSKQILILSESGGWCESIG